MTTIVARVTLEQTASGRFVARTDLKPQGEGATAEEAVADLRTDTASPLEPIRTNDHPNPWVALAEAFQGDPAVGDWLAVMEEIRRRDDPVPELEAS